LRSPSRPTRWVDGSGARLSGSALQYSAWLFLLGGVAMALYGLVHMGYGLVRAAVANWRLAIAGAVLSTAWHRHLGHDGGPDCAHRRAARNERAVCGALWHGPAA